MWRAAQNLAVRIYALTAQRAFLRQRSLRDQFERAAASVSNSVAEGFGHGTTQELLTFLCIARGLAGEARSMLCLLELPPDFANLKSEISHLKSPAENVSRQLRGRADSLQNTPIKGQRYLTEKDRRPELRRPTETARE